MMRLLFHQCDYSSILHPNRSIHERRLWCVVECVRICNGTVRIWFLVSKCLSSPFTQNFIEFQFIWYDKMPSVLFIALLPMYLALPSFLVYLLSFSIPFVWHRRMSILSPTRRNSNTLYVKSVVPCMKYKSHFLFVGQIETSIKWHRRSPFFPVNNLKTLHRSNLWICNAMRHVHLRIPSSDAKIR